MSDLLLAVLVSAACLNLVGSAVLVVAVVRLAGVVGAIAPLVHEIHRDFLTQAKQSENLFGRVAHLEQLEYLRTGDTRP